MFSRIGFYGYIGLLLVLTIVGCQSKTFQSHLLEKPPEPSNFALLSQGATAEASQFVPNHLPEEVIDGDTSSETWDQGSGWGCELAHLRTSDLNRRPYLQVNLPQPIDIRQIVVYTIDSKQYPAAKFGLKDYRIEYWHGTGWEQILTGDTVDKQYTARNNTRGVQSHDIRGRLVAEKVRLVPISSNDTQRQYQYMSRERPVYEVEGLARVMELQVLGFPVVSSQIIAFTPRKPAPETEAKAEREPTEQEKFQEVLKKYEEGYDTANLEQIMSCFSMNYSANGRTRDDVRAKAASFFELHDQVNMTLTDVRIHQNVVDGTAVIKGGYTLQYTPKANGKAQQTSGNLSLVLVSEEETWKIISVN